MNDDRLEEQARRLGAHAADHLDVERTVQAVIARLRDEPAGTASAWVWLQPAWLRVAAALVVLAGGGLVTRSLVLDRGRADLAHFVVEDLSGLSTTELQQVLSSLDETLDLSAPTAAEPSLEQLTEEQLRAVLRSLEG